MMKCLKRYYWVPAWTVLAVSAKGAEPDSTNLWQENVGGGFQSSVQSLSLQAGGAAGFKVFGGQERHDLDLFSLGYGHMLGGVSAADHWYRGNWEIRAELFGGTQFSPSSDWLIGLAPHLRYNFATGTRWVPFIDGGLGVAATGIGKPDLGGTFEFTVQPSVGVHWFMRDNLAVTCEAGGLHISSAGIHDPNLGVNCLTGMIGVTWFF